MATEDRHVITSNNAPPSERDDDDGGLGGRERLVLSSDRTADDCTEGTRTVARVRAERESKKRRRGPGTRDRRRKKGGRRRTAADDDGEGSDDGGDGGEGRPQSRGPIGGREQHHAWSVYRRNPVDFTALAEADGDFASAWNDLKRRRYSLQKHRRIREGDPDDSSSRTTSGESFSTHVDFDFNASLTRALLRRDFGIEMPSLPRGKLVPPVPQRLNYVLWVKELLLTGMATSTGTHADDDDGRGGHPPPSPSSPSSPSSSTVRHMNGIDIGTGASCILPLLLHSVLSDVRADRDVYDDDDEDGAQGGGENASGGGWRILATDVDVSSVESARSNVAANERPREAAVRVALVPQTVVRVGGEFRGPLLNAIAAADADGEERVTGFFRGRDPHPHFDFVVTNPPFYSTVKEASRPRRGDGRDRTDMTTLEGVYPGPNDDGVGGRGGGELAFVLDILRDSLTTRTRIGWYTSMIGRKETLVALERELASAGFPRGNVRSTEFVQGRQTRWGVAWTYLEVPARSVATVLNGSSRHFRVEIAARPPPPPPPASSSSGGRGASSVEWSSIESSSALDEVASRVREYARHHPPRDVAALTCSSQPSSRDRGRLLRREPPRDGTAEGGSGQGRRPVVVVLTITEDAATPAEAEAEVERGGNIDGPRTVIGGVASRNDGAGHVGDERDASVMGRPTSPSASAASSSRLSRSLLPPEGEFLVDVTVEIGGVAVAVAVAAAGTVPEPPASTAVTSDSSITSPSPMRSPGPAPASCLVDVTVRCHGHTTRGCAVANAFSSGVEGEVGRTNRRWRRRRMMISSSGEKATTT